MVLQVRYLTCTRTSEVTTFRLLLACTSNSPYTPCQSSIGLNITPKGYLHMGLSIWGLCMSLLWNSQIYMGLEVYMEPSICLDLSTISSYNIMIPPRLCKPEIYVLLRYDFDSTDLRLSTIIVSRLKFLI